MAKISPSKIKNDSNKETTSKEKEKKPSGFSVKASSDGKSLKGSASSASKDTTGGTGARTFRKKS